MATGSCRASAPAMADNTAPTNRSAAGAVVEVSAATCETGSALFTFSLPHAAAGASQIKRAACGKGTQPAVRETARTPATSSNRMPADSTWGDVERSRDDPPRVERERRGDSVIPPRTPSTPKRLTAPRPAFPAGDGKDHGDQSPTNSRRFKSLRVHILGGIVCCGIKSGPRQSTSWLQRQTQQLVQQPHVGKRCECTTWILQLDAGSKFQGSSSCRRDCG